MMKNQLASRLSILVAVAVAAAAWGAAPALAAAPEAPAPATLTPAAEPTPDASTEAAAGAGETSSRDDAADLVAPPTSPGAAPAARPEVEPELAAATGAAAIIALAIERTADGSGPFTPEDGPGADAGSGNGIVRTFDSITYRITVSSNGGAASNERFTLTAPAGTTWAGLPNTCLPEGSAITGQDLTCNVGTVAEGEVRATPAVLSIDALPDGSVVAITGSVAADDTVSPGPVASVPTTVSAAPRFDLSKDVVNSKYFPDVPGPDGTDGIVFQYPVAVAWEPVVPGQGLLGYERSDGTFTFQDDVSQMFGGLPSPATLFSHDGRAVCGPNTGAGFPGLPGGRGGRPTTVLDSGQFTCTQSAPGAPVDVTITGTDTDITPSSGIPSLSATGQPVAGGVKPYVISGYISIWVPTPAPGDSLIATNTFTPLQSTSISGAPNYEGTTEPLSNNSVDRNLSLFLPGGGYKFLGQTQPNGSTAVGSAKNGDPYVTPGTRIRSQVNLDNGGAADYVGAIACDVYDNRYQELTTLFGDHAVTTGWTGHARIEYAAFSFTDPTVGRDATCDDGDGPWYSSPEAVPGGVQAVGKIRVTGTVAGGTAGNLFSYFEILPAPNNTRVYDFGQLHDGTSPWIHDEAPAANGAGPLADSVIITQSKARVTKKIIDPGTTAATTPDRTSFVVAGTRVDYALYPTLTNTTPGGARQAVTVTDVLPAHTTYERGSGSLDPSSVETVVVGGEPREKLTWTLVDVEPNTVIDPITYQLSLSGTAPAGSVNNTVTVAADLDVSPENRRTALRAVQVTSSAGIGIQKTAVEPTVIVGDALEWTLEYRNTDVVPIDTVDVIDVLPTTRATGDQVDLAALVDADATVGENVRYSTSSPESISLDGNDPSNAPGGATDWFDGSRIGTGGVSLEDITAIRIHRTGDVAVGQVVTHTLTAVAPTAEGGDIVTNRFGLRATNLALPAFSNPATVTVVAGAVGDHVWDDTDGDGLQGDDEAGIPFLPVTLSGTDDRGDDVERTTTTTIAGSYVFSVLRPGTYTVAFEALPDRAWTLQGEGDDETVDSDVTEAGTAEVALATIVTGGTLAGVATDLTVDAGSVAVDPEAIGGEDGDGGSVGPVTPTDPVPVAEVDDGARASVARQPSRLAFTGTGPIALLLGALTILGLGTGFTVRGARRRRATA